MKFPQFSALTITLSAFLTPIMVTADCIHGQFYCYGALNWRECQYVEQELYEKQLEGIKNHWSNEDFAGPEDWLFKCDKGRPFIYENCNLDHERYGHGTCNWSGAFTSDHEDYGTKESKDRCRTGLKHGVLEKESLWVENKRVLMEGKLPTWSRSIRPMRIMKHSSDTTE